MKQVYSYLDKAGLECEKIMAEENVELALSYGVKQAPTLVVVDGEHVEKFAGAGATVPLTGFGATLAKGVREAVAQKGWFGALTGGLSASSGGITAAIVAALTAGLLFRSAEK